MFLSSLLSSVSGAAEAAGSELYVCVCVCEPDADR